MDRQSGTHSSGGDSAGDGRPGDGTVHPLVGETIADKYVVEEAIGAGGMAQVFKARQKILNREVAVKVLEPPDGTDLEREAFERMFLKEAAVAAGLKSPNSITIYDFGQAGDDTLYLVMEFLEGQTLQELLDDEEVLAAPRAAHIAVQVCRSLREAHEKGLVHRDVKPANVMLVDRNNDPDFVKVLDFGIAKNQGELGEDDEMSLLGRFVGSPRYASPEQLQQRSDVDHRADIYGCGLLLYAMLTGAPPFDGTPRELLHKHLLEPPEPIDEHNLQVPEALAALVYRCLEKDPAKRFADVTELIRALGTVSFGGDVVPPTTDADVADFALEIELDETDDALRTMRAEDDRRKRIAELQAGDPADETTDEFPSVATPAPDIDGDDEPPRRRSPWPLILVAGVGLALVIGLAIAILPSLLRDRTSPADPSPDGGNAAGRTAPAVGAGTGEAAGAGETGAATGGATGGAEGGIREILVEDAPSAAEGEPADGAGDGTGGDSAPGTQAPSDPATATPAGGTPGGGTTPSPPDGGTTTGGTGAATPGTGPEGGEEPTADPPAGEGAEGEDGAPSVEGYKDDPY